MQARFRPAVRLTFCKHLAIKQLQAFWCYTLNHCVNMSGLVFHSLIK